MTTIAQQRDKAIVGMIHDELDKAIVRGKNGPHAELAGDMLGTLTECTRQLAEVVAHLVDREILRQ